jgi:dUTP pyrophosphatase
MKKVNVKILNDKLKASNIGYATEQAAGVDLRACIDEPITISPHQIVKIPTGIAIAADGENYAEMPFCYLLFGRSGLGVKHGITLANSVGVIDADYRGEIVVGLINHSDEAFTINPLDRVAQLVMMPINIMSFNFVSELNETNRGSGGFGSTGTN